MLPKRDEGRPTTNRPTATTPGKNIVAPTHEEILERAWELNPEALLEQRRQRNKRPVTEYMRPELISAYVKRCRDSKVRPT